MNSSAEDYRKLFYLQDKFLAWWVTLNYPFYLTGGTALGRFYLNHRASDDLDFFCNANPEFNRYVSGFLEKVAEKFNVNKQQTLVTDDFLRLFITENDLSLKI
ncbi:MAG: nucleotidyl transferase AbiEii/AbiGii toxin family protein [Bacteroidota bacterium]